MFVHVRKKETFHFEGNIVPIFFLNATFYSLYNIKVHILTILWGLVYVLSMELKSNILKTLPLGSPTH